MKYIANPVEVDAFRITHVWPAPNSESNRRLDLEDGSTGYATPEMCPRMTPKPGDYWVRQADGYVYLSPKEVFERKYHPAHSPAENLQASA